MLKHALFQDECQTLLRVADNHEVNVATEFRETGLESCRRDGEGDVLFQVVEELRDLREPVC